MPVLGLSEQYTLKMSDKNIGKLLKMIDNTLEEIK